MSDLWPDNDHLTALIKESGEHRRAWAIIAGLSKRLQDERKPGNPKQLLHQMAKAKGPRPDGYVDRVRSLEEKIVNQKRQLALLEDCRKFEADTERMLVEALSTVVNPNSKFPRSVASMALRKWEGRRGPRPT